MYTTSDNGLVFPNSSNYRNLVFSVEGYLVLKLIILRTYASLNKH